VSKNVISELVDIKKSDIKELHFFYRKIFQSAFKENERIGYNLKGSNRKLKVDAQKLKCIIGKTKIVKTKIIL
jgi:hypothetical protein